MNGAQSLAFEGARDVQAAQRDALEAIAKAEANGYQVGEDLSITDVRPADIATLELRHIEAMEHYADISWGAEQLVATDSLIARRLIAAANELEGIRFESTEQDDTIELLDHRQVPDGEDASNDVRDPEERIAFAGGWQYPWDPPPPADSAPG